jgi:peroxiredoxin-like protein
MQSTFERKKFLSDLEKPSLASNSSLLQNYFPINTQILSVFPCKIYMSILNGHIPHTVYRRNTMSDAHFYNVEIEWTSERKGMAHANSLQDLEVATPPEFPKGHPGIWSPENLFVASANSCFMTTFLAIAENSKLAFTSFKSKGIGKLEKVDGKFTISEIILTPSLVIPNEADREKAEKILHKSESACLISNSMKTKVTLENVNIQIG